MPFERQHFGIWGPRIGDSLFLAEVEAEVATARLHLLQRLRECVQHNPRHAMEYARVNVAEANDHLRRRLREHLVEFEVELRDNCFWVVLHRSEKLQVLTEHDQVKTIGYLPGEDVPRTSFTAARKVEL